MASKTKEETVTAEVDTRDALTVALDRASSIADLDPAILASLGVIQSDGMDKAGLEGVPFVVVGYEPITTGYGAGWRVEILTANERGVFVDHGTGIDEQLTKLFEQGVKAFRVPKGLRASHYKYTDDEGKEIPATTYYLG